METTFITIHDLSQEARILYTSDSIIDILGYSPEEVVNRSAWDFFHEDEIPLARARHDAGIQMDKAAVLSYCLLKDSTGNWLGCEVVFTVVFDVMVGCISIYRRGLKSRNRAAHAPIVRRMFSNSPKDPRYHMLSHLSAKFTLPPLIGAHEPRAALFLNRYTRTLTIMYATDGLADILGISGEELRGRSFYYCIEENCLQEAVRCLENAKANDSIAYLRFWYRDPRQNEAVTRRRDMQEENSIESTDEIMEDVDETGQDQDMDHDSPMSGQGLREQSLDTVDSQPVSSSDSVEAGPMAPNAQSQSAPPDNSRTSSGWSSAPYNHEAVFGEPEARHSSASSISNSPTNELHNTRRGIPPRRRIELEAVVSCTSDGLVVCMRRARPVVAHLAKRAKPMYANGLFAVPWATEPMMPSPQQRPRYAPRSPFVPELPPTLAQHSPSIQTAIPGQDDFMSAIREIAVFAWALTGINGSLAEYGRGVPRGEAQPASGLPVWQPEAKFLEQKAQAGSHSLLTPGDFGPPAIPSESSGESASSAQWLRSTKMDSTAITNSTGRMIDGVDGVDGELEHSHSKHAGSSTKRGWSQTQTDGFSPMFSSAVDLVDGVQKDRNTQYVQQVGPNSQHGWSQARRDTSMTQSNLDGEMVDGVDGSGVDGYGSHNRQHTSMSSDDRNSSISPANARSYQLVPMTDKLGNMVDGDKDSAYHGQDGFEAHPPELQNKSQRSLDASMNDAMALKRNAGLDGAMKKRSPVDPYGFGDPGISSKGAKFLGNSLLQGFQQQDR